MTKVSRLSFVSFFVAIVVLLAFGAGYLARHRFPIAAVSAQTPADLQQHFKVFWDVWNIVRDDFVDKSRVQPVPMIQGAIRGMLEALDDPHTVYLDPGRYRLEQADLRGRFDGIGAQVAMENEQLTIVQPMEGSPAEKAGLQPGDKIVKIDGEDAGKLTLAEAVNKIRGPKGTTVVLTVLRPGQTEALEIPIIRGEIENPSVSVDEPAPGIARLRIRTFGRNTDEEVAKALDSARVRNADGLIVDVRGNPGGLLDVTVRITGQFLDQGQILAQEDGDGNRRVWNDEPGGLATKTPLVVLINGASASGSEVLAGALRDHGRAKLIGEKTFGKGSVNYVHELADGGAVYVTFARWHTPSGRLIEGQGIPPDIEVKQTPEIERQQGDLQIRRAIAELKRE